MKLVLQSIGCIALFSLSMSAPIAARDFGVEGQAFPVIEPDLLSVIEAKLRNLEASGEMDRMNKAMVKKAQERVRRPQAVAGISPAEESRQWNFDPTITIDKDVKDQKGNLVARRGQSVNPLDFSPVKQALVFVDGDNLAQLDWATKRYQDAGAKIIFVQGSPFDEMTKRQRRFYFDQGGKLTSKFGIKHTPAVVKQDGRVMSVEEVALKGGQG